MMFKTTFCFLLGGSWAARLPSQSEFMACSNLPTRKWLKAVEDKRSQQETSSRKHLLKRQILSMGSTWPKCWVWFLYLSTFFSLGCDVTTSRPVLRPNWTYWSNGPWLSLGLSIVWDKAPLLLKFTHCNSSCETFWARELQFFGCPFGFFFDCHCAELDATPAELCFDPKAIHLFWQHISMCHSYCFISPPRKPFVSINFRMLLESNFCYLLRVGDPSHSPRIILTKAQSLLTAESWRDWLTANLREEKILWTGVHFTTKLTCARRRVFNDARQEMMWVSARLGVVLVQKSRPSSPGGDRKSTWKEK